MLQIDQPKVSALVRGRLAGFSLDRLVRFLVLLGSDVEIVVKPRVRAPIGLFFSFGFFGLNALGGIKGFIPAILLRLMFQRYYAQCARCKNWLMVKRTDATDVTKSVET